MQVPVGMQLRVVRLLNGNATAQDLDRIFLWLRERPYGRAAVRDIGDFVAHWAERDAGISCQHARDIYDTIEAHVAVTVRKDATLAVVAQGMRAAFALDDPARLRNETGIGVGKMRKAVQSAINNMQSFDAAQNVAYGDFSEEEQKAIARYVGQYRSTAVFTGDDLARELSELLLKFGLVTQEAVIGVLQQTEFIAAYAISKMHSSKIISENREPIDLRLGLHMGPPADGLGIWAMRNVDCGNGSPTVAFPLFTTNCKPEDWCPDIADEHNVPELELVDGRLVPVG